MKKAVCIVLAALLVIMCFTGCGKSSNHNDISGISEDKALSLFQNKLFKVIESSIGSKYYDLSMFEYRFNAVKEEGSEYRITGEYDVYSSSGKYLKTYGFSGTVNKHSTSVVIDSIFK